MNIVTTRPTIVLMFSGGLDSTACLYLLLTREEYQKYDIHVHHIILKNEENRYKAESIAVSNVLEYFHSRDYRLFSYSESVFEYPSFNGSFMWDSDIYNLVAGSFAGTNPNIVVAIGRTKTDTEHNSSQLSSRIQSSYAIFDLFTNDNLRYSQLKKTLSPKFYPVYDYTKKQIWNLLPSDLRILTWSCRTPKYIGDMPTKCERCIACRTLESG